MQPRYPSLLPFERVDRDRMQAIQQEINARADFTDAFGYSAPADLLIAGIDQAFTKETVVCAVVLMQNGTVVETLTTERPVTIPYIPGYLAFREGPPIRKALESLELTPDIILFDGNGRLHPRQAGLATHLGVVYDHPTIGVAKSLLCGTLAGERKPPFAAGTTHPIFGTDDTDTPLGYAVQTRQWDRPGNAINPVYVSPGHRCSAETAVAIVQDACAGYKLPEPIRQADALAADVRSTTATR